MDDGPDLGNVHRRALYGGHDSIHEVGRSAQRLAKCYRAVGLVEGRDVRKRSANVNR